MKIGIPKEIKNHEYRVALTPAGAQQLIENGHEVFIETGAGQGSAITDEQYIAAGASILPEAKQVWQVAEMICKVKEPIAEEFKYLRSDLLLFTYLHLAADLPCTKALMEAGTTAIAYETVRMQDGSLPLLAPMSEVAGRLATQVGAYHMGKQNNGSGCLLGGVPGVSPAKVVVLGGGVVGQHAAEIALGMRADVTILDISVAKLRELDVAFNGQVHTLVSNSWTIQEQIRDADLVIGAVLVTGAKAPQLITNEMVATMRSGAVLVDVAVDQGGCFADTKATTHENPTYPVHDTVFYCVANMPGSVPVTSTQALTNATLPYLTVLANLGWREAIVADGALNSGLTTHDGGIYNDAVAQAHGLVARSTEELVLDYSLSVAS